MAPFYRRERLDYRFFPAFFFPPLAFFAIVCYPPLHVGLLRERSRASVVAAAWHAHQKLDARRFGTRDGVNAPSSYQM